MKIASATYQSSSLTAFFDQHIPALIDISRRLLDQAIDALSLEQQLLAILEHWQCLAVSDAKIDSPREQAFWQTFDLLSRFQPHRLRGHWAIRQQLENCLAFLQEGGPLPQPLSALRP
ncbi:hypothetical protein [Gallaecimonas sp. GXIMD1310]|uniref:hypothetical protein n=1 Tax=Gallaecimonas sp. GXIMD1310 TaxID=3131926 RepID=UPI00324DE19E